MTRLLRGAALALVWLGVAGCAGTSAAPGEGPHTAPSSGSPGGPSVAASSGASPATSPTVAATSPTVGITSPTVGATSPATAAGSLTTVTTSPSPLPVTVVPYDGVASYSGILAATSLAGLRDELRARTTATAAVCPYGCFTSAVVPADSLLVAFSPSGDSCNTPQSVSARLSSPETLAIDVTVAYTCSGQGGGGARNFAPDMLVALPLSALPHGRLTVVGRGDNGAQSTTISLP